MRMKIFNKGQVVIPVGMREGLGIAPGDFVDVAIDLQHRKIELRPSKQTRAVSLAGSLTKYRGGKPFLTRKQAADVLRKGLDHEG
jgi:AbrB family looped-hinge helix DNA binding protein